MGYVMTRVSDKVWQSILPQLRQGVREGTIDPRMIEDKNYKPTHILDIYKMRRGRYKNVRIWTNLNLGNGRRTDLFMTSYDNQPMGETIDLYNSAIEIQIKNWKKIRLILILYMNQV